MKRRAKKRKMADFFKVKDLSPERNLKKYQLKKYGKCFQCGADIIKDCKASHEVKIS